MRTCRQCGKRIVGRAPSARFCCHDCTTAWHREHAKSRRLAEKPVRHCRWCASPIPRERFVTAAYCCDECQYRAEKKRDREKIAHYRASDPDRYRAHRRKQNDRRAEANAALKIIRDIETKGLVEALL